MLMLLVLQLLLRAAAHLHLLLVLLLILPLVPTDTDGRVLPGGRRGHHAGGESRGGGAGGEGGRLGRGASKGNGVRKETSRLDLMCPKRLEQSNTQILSFFLTTVDLSTQHLPSCEPGENM